MIFILFFKFSSERSPYFFLFKPIFSKFSTIYKKNVVQYLYEEKTNRKLIWDIDLKYTGKSTGKEFI